MRKPLTPKAHAAMDYGLMVGLVTVPRLLGLSERAQTVFAALGLNAGAVNALTAQPLSVKPVISFKSHQMVDLGAMPVYFLVPAAAGVAKEPRARVLWLAMAACLAATYVLTDWDAGTGT
ncbi:hypothetical protein PU560_07245 [Georgenia sp. 10Sc9-8]|uniref:Uncharacterized protein n=1 Tax=Georgenia halotolerans TaxID=3028317 RepID=A0ABT5TWA0_9MICO|nr:hypothetical protein [Georgenia halotolerans]